LLAPLALAAEACVPAAPVGYGEVAPAEAEAIGDVRFETLRRLIVTHGVRTIDELLPLLPRSFRSHYVLMYDSRSLQAASGPEPRALLFTEDARFVAAFHGRSAGGSETMETMEFDDARRAFVLREVAFDEARAGGEPVISEANPRRCTSCHRAEPQPIWDAYPTWPGAYGEQEHARPGEDEAAGLAAFLATEGDQPRYRALVGLESLLVRPVSKEVAAYEGRSRPSANSVFGVRLQELDYLVIARKVIGVPRFGPFRYALLAALEPQCLDVRAFVPDRVRASFERDFEAFERETEAANAEEAASKRARTHSHADPEVRRPTETLTPFRYVVEEGLGLSTSGWTLALECHRSSGSAVF
jgi:hypothetical protein